MRRVLMTTLVLLPVLAHAQARTMTEPRPSNPSAVLQAELNQPAGLAHLAMAAAAEAPIAISGAASVPVHFSLHEVVQTRVNDDDFVEAAMRLGGTLEYSMKASVPTEASAAKVTRAVEIELSQKELASQPAVSKVVIHAVVDEHGIPRNVTVAQSAGNALIDQRAVAAVNQYRFQPATVDSQPVWSSISIAIKLQKQQ